MNYYIEGTTTPVPGIETNPVTGKGYVGQVISIEHPEVTTGYKVCEDQPTSLTVTNDGKATATVYYEVDTEQTFDYTVNYYIEGTRPPSPASRPTRSPARATSARSSRSSTLRSPPATRSARTSPPA